MEKKEEKRRKKGNNLGEILGRRVKNYLLTPQTTFLALKIKLKFEPTMIYRAGAY
jgi:hypothetical protein